MLRIHVQRLQTYHFAPASNIAKKYGVKFHVYVDDEQGCISSKATDAETALLELPSMP